MLLIAFAMICCCALYGCGEKEEVGLKDIYKDHDGFTSKDGNMQIFVSKGYKQITVPEDMLILEGDHGKTVFAYCDYGNYNFPRTSSLEEYTELLLKTNNLTGTEVKDVRADAKSFIIEKSKPYITNDRSDFLSHNMSLGVNEYKYLVLVTCPGQGYENSYFAIFWIGCLKSEFEENLEEFEFSTLDACASSRASLYRRRSPYIPNHTVPLNEELVNLCGLQINLPDSFTYSGSDLGMHFFSAQLESDSYKDYYLGNIGMMITKQKLNSEVPPEDKRLYELGMGNLDTNRLPGLTPYMQLTTIGSDKTPAVYSKEIWVDEDAEYVIMEFNFHFIKGNYLHTIETDIRLAYKSLSDVNTEIEGRFYLWDSAEETSFNNNYNNLEDRIFEIVNSVEVSELQG